MRGAGACAHLSRGGPGWGERELRAQGTGAPSEGDCTPATEQEARMLTCPRFPSLQWKQPHQSCVHNFAHNTGQLINKQTKNPFTRLNHGNNSKSRR